MYNKNEEEPSMEHQDALQTEKMLKDRQKL
jgi:hypothetical protein